MGYQVDKKLKGQYVLGVRIICWGTRACLILLNQPSSVGPGLFMIQALSVKQEV